MQDCTSFFSSFFFSLIVQSNMQRQVTILLKVTACLVFSVCFRRWSHSPVHFPTVLILHSECILVLSSCPIWHKAIKPKMRQTGLWICRSGLCYFHQALLGGNMLPGKPRASSRRRPPLLLTELGRAWASLRSERGQGLAAGPGESCFTLTEVFQTQMQGWILLEKFFVNPRGKIGGKPACCSISAYSRSVVIRKCIKCKCIKCYCIKIALPGTGIFHILNSLNNTKLKVSVQRAKLLFFQIHD